jgi:hypothetical protein
MEEPSGVEEVRCDQIWMPMSRLVKKHIDKTRKEFSVVANLAFPIRDSGSKQTDS